MFAKQLPLAERLSAIGNQANKAGDYASAAKMYDAAYALGGNVSKRISAANMKLKCGQAEEAQEIYEMVLVVDTAALPNEKLSDKARDLVVRKLEEAKVAIVARELFPGWQPSQGVITMDFGQLAAATSTPSRNSFGSASDTHSIAGSMASSPSSSFESHFRPSYERRERVSGPMKAVVDECMVHAAQANKEGSFAAARTIYLACHSIMPAKVEVRPAPEGGSHRRTPRRGPRVSYPALFDPRGPRLFPVATCPSPIRIIRPR